VWNYDNGRQQWSPENYDRKFRGIVSLRTTLEDSLNVPLVRVFFERFPSGDLLDALEPVRALGLVIPPNRATPSAVLGAVEQRPIDILVAMLKLSRRALGISEDRADLACTPAFTTTTNSGDLEPVLPNPLEEASPGQRGARLTISALEGALRHGTSKALGARLPKDQAWAGKTGTSSDLRDAWYVALSPRLVVLSWVGRDDNAKTKFTGASGAMPLALPIIKEWADRPAQNSGWTWTDVPQMKWRWIDSKSACQKSQSETLPSNDSSPIVAPRDPGATEIRELFSKDTVLAPCA
jgi:penicillin-binding protein 1B